MASAKAERTEAGSEDALLALAAAEAALLARRHVQAGAPTLGDDQDAALLAALQGLPSAAAPHARASAQRLGEHVYARRFFEDHLPGAIRILSDALDRSGAGSLRLLGAFHRSARIEHAPSAVASRWDAAVRAATMEGLLEGYLGAAFNSHVDARAEPQECYRVELRAGRDVNRGRPP